MSKSAVDNVTRKTKIQAILNGHRAPGGGLRERRSAGVAKVWRRGRGQQKVQGRCQQQQRGNGKGKSKTKAGSSYALLITKVNFVRRTLATLNMYAGIAARAMRATIDRPSTCDRRQIQAGALLTPVRIMGRHRCRRRRGRHLTAREATAIWLRSWLR